MIQHYNFYTELGLDPTAEAHDLAVIITDRILALNEEKQEAHKAEEQAAQDQAAEAQGAQNDQNAQDNHYEQSEEDRVRTRQLAIYQAVKLILNDEKKKALYDQMLTREDIPTIGVNELNRFAKTGYFYPPRSMPGSMMFGVCLSVLAAIGALLTSAYLIYETGTESYRTTTVATILHDYTTGAYAFASACALLWVALSIAQSLYKMLRVKDKYVRIPVILQYISAIVIFFGIPIIGAAVYLEEVFFVLGIIMLIAIILFLMPSVGRWMESSDKNDIIDYTGLHG